MKTYRISIRDKDSRPLFKGDKEAASAVVACNLALIEVAQKHGSTPVSHLSLWCEEVAALGSPEAVRANANTEGLTLR
jgi:hypothetical protein